MFCHTKNLSEFLKWGRIVCPQIWGRFGTKLMGTDRPGDGSSRGLIIQGMDHPGDRSSWGRVVTKNLGDGSLRGWIVTGTDHYGDGSLWERIVTGTDRYGDGSFGDSSSGYPVGWVDIGTRTKVPLGLLHTFQK
jgi:hypothetical protein